MNLELKLVCLNSYETNPLLLLADESSTKIVFTRRINSGLENKKFLLKFF